MHGKRVASLLSEVWLLPIPPPAPVCQSTKVYDFSLKEKQRLGLAVELVKVCTILLPLLRWSECVTDLDKEGVQARRKPSQTQPYSHSFPSFSSFVWGLNLHLGTSINLESV